MSKDGYLELGDYGIVGDTLSAALIGKDGSVDWLCLPRFDSASVFGAILDRHKGGHFRLWAERAEIGVQRYDGYTNILITNFRTPRGILEVTDFMPVRDKPGHGQELHRIIRCLEGRVKVNIHCSPRPDYAREPVRVERAEDRYVFRSASGDFELLTVIPLHVSDSEVNGAVGLEKNNEQHFVFREYRKGRVPDLTRHALSELRKTRKYWGGWADRCIYGGPWEEVVRRSALVLKMLVYSPMGSIVAAPTTSLPEAIRGERNWDYRFSWLRDAALTLNTFSSLGYQDEYVAYMGWIRRLCAECGLNLQVLFGIEGPRDMRESVLTHFEGYRRSRPVRIGNAAAIQFQLDVYGEVLDAAYHHLSQGGVLEDDTLHLLIELVGFIVNNWHKPDQGIWEMRTGVQHYLYSKLMCWVALDRGLKIASLLKLTGVNRTAWRRAKVALEAEIDSRGWNKKMGSFSVYYDSASLDASLLNFPLLGYLKAKDPRAAALVGAVEKQLRRGNLVMRYAMPDGLSGGEGAFLLCACWLADCKVLLGDADGAAEIIDSLWKVASPLGLLAEEADPSTGRLLGNYPQAMSHLGLVNSVLNFRARFPNYL